MDQQHAMSEPWFPSDEQPPSYGLRNEVETQRGIIADLQHRLAVAESQRAQLAAQMIPIVEQAEKLAQTVGRFVEGGERYEPGQMLTTPGQFIAWWADLEPERRRKEAERALRAANDAQRCFEQDHAGRIETLEAQCQLLMAGRRPHEDDARVGAAGFDITSARRLLDQIGEASRPRADGNRCPDWYAEGGPETTAAKAVEQEGTG